MLLYAIFNSLPNFIDIETNCLRNYNMLELCHQSLISANKVVKLATMYWKSPSYEIFSDRKKDCKFYTQFIAGTSSLSSFSHYISLVLFRRRVCYSVITESFKQIYEIFFFSARKGWNLTEVQVWWGEHVSCTCTDKDNPFLSLSQCSIFIFEKFIDFFFNSQQNHSFKNMRYKEKLTLTVF